MYNNLNHLSEHLVNKQAVTYIQKFAAHLFSKKIKKKEIILREGEINDHMIFVKSGLLRVYAKNDDKEINTWFVKEDEFIVSINSYFYETPSFEYIQAIEDSEIFMMKKSNYNFMLRNNHKLTLFAIEIMYLHLCEYQDQCQVLRFMSAEQKYKYLKDKKPDLIDRLSQKHIASFLGIETTYLSKIIANYKE